MLATSGSASVWARWQEVRTRRAPTGSSPMISGTRPISESETDAAVIYNTPWKQQVALEFAAYDANDWATDTTTLWIWTSWGF